MPPAASSPHCASTIFAFGMHAHAAKWVPPLSLFALLSMAVGNVLALPQTDLRRLLGYSGIAQMGYVLVALATNIGFIFLLKGPMAHGGREVPDRAASGSSSLPA